MYATLLVHFPLPSVSFRAGKMCIRDRCGAGLGIVFNCNGSTGGTDIIAAIIHKYKDVTLGRMVMACDFIIIDVYKRQISFSDIFFSDDIYLCNVFAIY